jgi:uncharacterized protein YraI
LSLDVYLGTKITTDIGDDKTPSLLIGESQMDIRPKSCALTVAIALSLGFFLVACSGEIVGDRTTSVELNMRSGPSTSAPIVAVLARDTVVQLDGTVSGDWARAHALAGDGWIEKHYLPVN